MNITPVAAPGHEQVVRVEDRAAGLLGFIAIHSTLRGPAAGGLRMRLYATEAEALDDVLRLSRGMSYKNAAADLPLGGGKAVIVGDPAVDKTERLLTAFGRAMNAIEGRYWTAEDMGMSPSDLAVIARQTPFVAGLSDGPFASGDPSPVTARGIFNAIRTTARHRLSTSDLAGCAVAVQGLGHVGERLCLMLCDAGARLIVSDVNPARVERVVRECGAHGVAPENILGVEADVLAPCAIGGVLNECTIPQLRVAAVAGGANNQLATPEDGRRLHLRGILYAPDFVANAGGIVNVATEILRIEHREAWVAAKLGALDTTLDAIFTRATLRGESPSEVAEGSVEPLLARHAA